jgi:hypothetical protein
MPTDTTWDADELTVALPNIFTTVDTILTDTVFIRSDSMKVAKDLKVGLTFIGDKTAMLVDPTAGSLVACAGYRYKSRWTANENLTGRDTIYHKTYYRQYPAGDTLYKWWNDTTAKCLNTFKRDSLYVVGGKLTILGKGKLKTVKNELGSLMAIDNSFKITSDTFATVNYNSINTKMILIDKDPTNSSFLPKFVRDRIRAIAWREYAGSSDPTHCYNSTNYNPRWNHYWDDRIVGADTCQDSLTPCENASWTDTGIMQIIRKYRGGSPWSWERHFSTPNNAPSGYQRATWDSLAWNWTINIFNGKYIHDNYYSYLINKDTIQNEFPDSCAFSDCGFFPLTKNKEDLRTYAYHSGENAMSKILNDSLWSAIIGDTLPPIREDADYVQKVRRYNYEKPWQ